MAKQKPTKAEKPVKVKPTKAEKDARRAARLPERFIDVPVEDIPKGLRRRLEREGVVAPVPTEPPVVHVPAPVLATLTPTKTGDPVGNVGDLTADDEYIYFKTTAGWKRSTLRAF